ncbi:NACHT domain-containing protein [Sideroxyarcus sp. TK5]
MGFMEREQGVTWPELLKHRLVVILGEPGSGKSSELHAQHNQFHSRSLFFELHQLVTENLSDILDEVGKHRFNAWKQGRGEMTFFLDAVDESKIQRADDFFTALDRLKKAIGIAMPRARFVISSRISAWRPENDRVEVLRRFAVDPVTGRVEGRGTDGMQVGPAAPKNSEVKQEKESEAKEIVVVALLPLSTSQVEKYSIEKNTNKCQAFIAALEESNAWAFAGRPLDVDLLHTYWNDKGQLGNLTALSEYMIAKLLEETHNRSNQEILNPKKIREGAEFLGAATVFCRRLNFRIPDMHEAAGEDILSTADVLPEDWLPKERYALLDRALFDAARHGAMTFHHRYHSDYLAAAWITRLMNSTCTTSALEDLLFAVVNAKRVMRSSLKPVAAWLITDGNEPWRQTLAEWILESCPEIHLAHGDPSALPLEYRCKVLAKLVERYQGRKHVRLNLDHAALARFANDGLTEEINRYLQDSSIAEDLRADLLLVVRAGKMVACLPTALAIFSEPSTSDDLRTYVASVIRDAGDEHHRRQLAQAWQGLPDISNSLLARLCEALFPHVIGADELLVLLQKSNEVPHYGTDLPFYLGALLKESLSPTQAQELLDGILGLLGTPPLKDKHALSQHFYWLTSLIPICLRRLFDLQNLSIEAQELAVSAVFVLEQAARHGDTYRSTTAEDEPSVQQLLTPHHELRRKLFWARVARSRHKHSREPARFELGGYGTVVPLVPEDIGWLLTDAVSDLPLADRRLALDSAANQLLTENKSLWLFAWILLSNTKGAPELLALCRQYVWGRLRAPFMMVWYRHFQHKLLERYWWNAKFHNLQRQYRKLRDRWWLWRHLSELRKGLHPYTLAHFAHDAGGDSSSQYGGSNWDKVTQEWGRAISAATKQGCEVGWRRFSPPLPHEKSERNSVDNRLFVGLSGLQTLWREGRLDFSALPSADVELLVLYACNELNGFPEWFPALLEGRPAEAARVLARAVEGEWSYPAEMEHVHDVVARLAWMPSPVAMLAQLVMERLLAGDPANPHMLKYALDVIMRSNADAAVALLSVAKTRAVSYAIEQPQWFNWMNIWLQLDAFPALDYLESVLAASSEKADEVVVGLCSAMSGRHDDQRQIRNPSYQKSHSLARFIPLVYRHIREDQDIHRAGQGVYSPGSRDHAQDFREGLLRMLGSSKESEAEDVLRALLDAPELSKSHDWILHLLDERKNLLADVTHWEAKDVRVFAKEYRSEPRSDYQLFRLVTRLLVDIKFHVESSENAANRLWIREGDLEADFRGMLQDRLSERSLGWFNVVQEKEVDRKERPDLAIERNGLNSLPIEVKLAERWPASVLFERLENQLVGQYLRPANIRHGLYVLGNTVTSKHWKMPGSGRKVDFHELISLLQERARSLQTERRAHVDGIEVIGIDFSDPR